MITEIIWLILGLIGLWLGSEFAVRGAQNIAAHLNISAGFIGLTILSIGTSVPEMAVSIAGGIDRLGGIDASGLVVGNVIGSAANLLTIILGIVGMVGTLAVQRRILAREDFMLISSIVLVGVLGADGFFSRIDGIILITIYLCYLFVLTRQEKKHTRGKPTPRMHPWLDASFLAGGLLLVAFASNVVVKNGILLADVWGVSQTFIGIFVVGLGTGLPELAVSLAALRKGEVEMSVANLIGSNICDLLFSLGVGTVITGFAVPARVLVYDIPALLVISGTVLLLFRSGLKLTKRESASLIGLYFFYLGLRLYLFN